MFCKFCGQTLTASAVKCNRCGREVPARSDCGGFFGILPGAAPVQGFQPAADIPAEKPVKKQIPVFSVILALLLAAALVLIALQGSRLGELEKQLTELHEELAEIKDDLEDHLDVTSQSGNNEEVTVPEQPIPNTSDSADTVPQSDPVESPVQDAEPEADTETDEPTSVPEETIGG